MTPPSAPDDGEPTPTIPPMAARRNAIPLTPAMIEDLKHRFDAVQHAKAGDDQTSIVATRR